MKGLKKSMSIKAFCKRGLAVVLACAMVATGLPAMATYAEETSETTTTEPVNFASTEERTEILVENAKANSEQVPEEGSDGGAGWAFDGVDTHYWHSRWSGSVPDGETSSGLVSESNPIWIQSGFDEVWAVKEVHYASRGNGNYGNVIGQYMIQLACLSDATATPTDADFVTVKTGTLAETTDEQTISLDAYYRATHVRLVALSELTNSSDHITARLISFHGKDITADATVTGYGIDCSAAKTVYKLGEALDTTGIRHTSVYSDGTVSLPVSGATYGTSGYNADALGKQTVTVTYEEASLTSSTTFTANVGVFADTETLVENAKANSEQLPVGYDNDGGAAWAFDGNDSHWWHSRYQNFDQIGDHEVASGEANESNPIWIQSGFDKVWAVKEVHYAPRGNSDGNRIGEYEIQIACLSDATATPADADFVTVKTGTLANTGNEQTIELDAYYRATHVRLVALSEQTSGSDYVTAKLISFYGKDIDEAATVTGYNIDCTSAKKDYKLGEELDTTGIRHTSVYSDGTESIPTVADAYTVTGYDAMTFGEKELTVSYEGSSETYLVDVGAYDSTVLAANAMANSEQLPVAWTNDGGATWAFDDEAHWWHSRYQNFDQKGEHEVDTGAVSATNPIWIQTGFEKAWMVKEVTYLGRTDNSMSRINAYTLYVANLEDPSQTPVDTDFKPVASGNFDNSAGVKKITLDEFVKATHIRLETTSVHTNGGTAHVAAERIKVYGADIDTDALIEETIVLGVGENYTKEVAENGTVTVVDETIATAEVATTEETSVVLYNHGETTVNESISMENAAWKFKQVTDGWNIYNESTGLYFVNSRTAGFGSTTAETVTVDVVTSTNGNMEAVQIWRPDDRDASQKRYLIYCGGDTIYDAVSVASTATNDANNTWVYNLKLLEKQEAVSETDILPGWALAEELKDGGEYVIAHVTDSAVIILYPQAARNASATKTAEALTTEVHTLSINGLAVGTTNVWVGNTIYKVDVKAPEVTTGNVWVNYELPKSALVDGLSVTFDDAANIFSAYEVWVTADADATWTDNKDAYTIVCEGTWDDTTGTKTTKFKPVEAVQICLVSKDEAVDSAVVGAAEISYADTETADYFIGGALRMDYAADTYDKTSLRLMYVFPAEFNGMTADTENGSWGWNYGLTTEMMTSKSVDAGKWLVKDGMINSNLVFKGVASEQYNKVVYAQLAVTYSDTTGDNTLTVYDSVIGKRSVKDVATAITNAYANATDANQIAQYNYALGILGETVTE